MAPKKTTKKTSSKQPAKKRIRELPAHRSFRLTKKRVVLPKSLPKVREVLRVSIKTVRDNKRIFFGLALMHALLSFVVVQGLGTTFSIVDTKAEFEEVLGKPTDLGASFALFGYLLGASSGQVSEVAGTYQLMFFVVTVLATIWLTRQILAGESPQLRDGYYKGMHPFIPFCLVLIVIGLQFVPALIGNFLYATVISQGLAVTGLETALWLLLFILLVVLSLYMVISSLFALYIATLPDVRPMQALRSARQLVLHRRLGVMLRVLALPLLVTIVLAIIFIPLIIAAPVAVEPLFLLVSSMILVYSTVYLYHLYKGLL